VCRWLFHWLVVFVNSWCGGLFDLHDVGTLAKSFIANDEKLVSYRFADRI